MGMGSSENFNIRAPKCCTVRLTRLTRLTRNDDSEACDSILQTGHLLGRNRFRSASYSDKLAPSELPEEVGTERDTVRPGKNGRKVPDQRKKVLDNFSTIKEIFRTYEINTCRPIVC